MNITDPGNKKLMAHLSSSCKNKDSAKSLQNNKSEIQHIEFQ